MRSVRQVSVVSVRCVVSVSCFSSFFFLPQWQGVGYGYLKTGMLGTLGLQLNQ